MEEKNKVILKSVNYLVASGKSEKLLTQAEVKHLKDIITNSNDSDQQKSQKIVSYASQIKNTTLSKVLSEIKGKEGVDKRI